MVTVMFFARLKEQLGCAQVALDVAQFNDDNICIKTIITHLCTQHPQWTEWLLASDVLAAVNQTICDQTTRVSDGDEVAFFPPVTGG